METEQRTRGGAAHQCVVPRRAELLQPADLRARWRTEGRDGARSFNLSAAVAAVAAVAVVVVVGTTRRGASSSQPSEPRHSSASPLGLLWGAAP